MISSHVIIDNQIARWANSGALTGGNHRVLRRFRKARESTRRAVKASAVGAILLFFIREIRVIRGSDLAAESFRN